VRALDLHVDVALRRGNIRVAHGVLNVDEDDAVLVEARGKRGARRIMPADFRADLSTRLVPAPPQAVAGPGATLALTAATRVVAAAPILAHLIGEDGIGRLGRLRRAVPGFAQQLGNALGDRIGLEHATLAGAPVPLLRLDSEQDNASRPRCV